NPCALLTSTSSAPKRATLSATIPSTSARRPTSTVSAIASPPAARISSAVRSARCAFSSATQTRAPSRANTSAMPRPMPWPAPVTIATLPASRPMAGLSRRAVERAPLVPAAVQRPPPPLVGEDRVLDRLAHAALHVRRRADALHELERLVAVLLLGVGVHLEVLHPHAVILVEALVERLRVPAHAGDALARVAEGGE